MNLVTITIQVDPISEKKAYLHAHITHPRGERTWRGTYQGSALRASLGGIWLALKELDNAKLYKCIVNLKTNQDTRDVINDFLWQTATENVANAYEYLRPLLRKHTVLIPEHWTGILPEELIEKIKHFWGLHHLRTRLPRAAQLVAMGAVKAVSEQEWEVFSQTQPNGNPYTVLATPHQGRQKLQCNCLDNNPACKHVLAVTMQSRIKKTKGNHNDIQS